MRKNLLKLLKSLSALVLCVSLLFTFLVGDSAQAAIADFNSTRVFFDEERILAPGVILNIWKGIKGTNSYKAGHTISFNPSSSDAKVMAVFGNSVSSRSSLTAESKKEEAKQGVSVIGGINGDFYTLDTGVPIGIVIQNRKLICYSNNKWNAVGFNADGSVIIDVPNIDMSFINNGNQYSFNNFNKSQNDSGPYLFSSDFGSTTGSKVPSLEVILDIMSGDLKVGGAVTAKISGIRIDSSSTPIGPNQLVLSARNNKPGFSVLAGLKMGDTLTFYFNDVENKWTNVEQAVGGDKILINNGVVTQGLSSTNFAPSTAVGIKADGGVVFLQVDGRSTLSQGVSHAETAQFLLKAGCVKALLLDGGGSSAMIARMPGNPSAGLLNNPSDGSERLNSNGLILISKSSIALKEGTLANDTSTQRLHMYPGKVYALPGSTVQFTVRATNYSYLPTEVTQPVTWVTNNGVIDNNGMMIVGSKTGRFDVMAGNAFSLGSSELTVPEKLTALKPSKTILSLLPGDTIDLSCEAYYENIKVISSDNSFNWQVEGDIGTITQDGVFTMSKSAQGKGRIIVSYGTTRAFVDVSIPSTPNAIEDFEGAIGWGYSSVRAKSAQVSVIKDSQLARSGSGVLKLDYDFTLGGGVEKGVAGVYAYTLNPNTNTKSELTLKGDPVAIGMWVYGDNSKSWLRGSIKDGSGQSFYIDFTPDYKESTGAGGVDWTGWRYLEAKIPAGKKGPFVFETPIRVMCSRDEMRTKGTMYFDQIRAIYSGENLVPDPVAKITSPADKAVLKSGKVPFEAEIITDPKGFGVDINSIRVLLDGVSLTGLSLTETNNIAIKGELGTELPLADGYHTLAINYTDLSGKQGTKSISFTVETGAPQIVANTPSLVDEGGTLTTTLDIKNPKSLRKIYAIITYDSNKLEMVDGDSKTPGIQIALEPWAAKGKIINNRVDTAAGRILLEIDNLTNLNSSDIAKLGTIAFKAKPSLDNTQIKLLLGAMIVGSNPSGQRYSLPDMNVSVDYPLILKVEGVNPGETTTLTVTDKTGKPVEGAEIYLNDFSTHFWTTDANGKVVTSLITPVLVEKQLKITAKKDGKTSKAVILSKK